MTDKETIDKAYHAIEVAKGTGKIKKGTNEVTKAIERGEAKLVAIANDVNPKEIVMHLPILCKEKEVICIEVGSKQDLGAAAGLPISTVSVAITNEGESKKILAELQKEQPKEESIEAPSDDKPKEDKPEPEEPVKEEKSSEESEAKETEVKETKEEEKSEKQSDDTDKSKKKK